MFARVTFINVKPDKVGDAIKLYEKSVLPAAESQKGFRGVLLLTDAAGGRGMSITLWDNEQDALDNEQSRYYQSQLVKFMPFFSGPPSREGFEVSLQVRR
jgi:heme-degrading monooxygenase HmoA